MVYCNYRGFEVALHVAAWLTADERRQFIGNDKVMLYICEEGVKPIVPRLRGSVNSAAIVLQNRDDGWKMGFFCRERVKMPKLVFPGNAVPLESLREHLLSVIIDANTAVMKSPPYDKIVERVLQDQIKAVFPDTLRPRSGTFGLKKKSIGAEITK